MLWCFYLSSTTVRYIYIHPQQRSHPGLGDWDNRERADYVPTLSRNRETAVCVCNLWFAHFTYKKGGSFIISVLSNSFSQKSRTLRDSTRRKQTRKKRKEAKISLKLLTYFISSLVYSVVVDVVFHFCCAVSFFVRDDVIFLSDDGRRRRRLRHSRCSSLALFLFFFFFGRLLLDAHLVVTLFVNKLIHRELRHAHLSIIRNDHSINTTSTNQPTLY